MKYTGLQSGSQAVWAPLALAWTIVMCVADLCVAYDLPPTQVPGTERSKSHLSVDEVEIGMGIHNEPGHTRIALPPLSELIAQLLNLITNTSDPERSFVPFKNDGTDEVVLVVNNLGGLSELEISGIVKSSTNYLATKMKIRRVLVGSFMVSSASSSVGYKND